MTSIVNPSTGFRSTGGCQYRSYPSKPVDKRTYATCRVRISDADERSRRERIISYPRRGAAHLLERLLPNRFGSEWRDEGNYVTFKPGGFASGTDDRATFSARLFYETNTLENLLNAHDVWPKRSLEVGCGYGRMTPWLARRADAHTAIDPNEEALASAQGLYPDVEFLRASATDLPFQPGTFDFALTWTVLQHLPPAAVRRAADSLVDCLVDGGYLLVCEKVHGDDYEHVWVRSRSKYETLFDGLDLVAHRTRRLEPTYGDPNGELLLFEA